MAMDGNGLRRTWQVLALVWLTAAACSTPSLRVKDMDRVFPENTIVDAGRGEAIDFDALVEALSAASVIYIGEEHTNAGHHAAQLRLIQTLHERFPDLTVGMEMFDFRYDMVLARWTAGDLEPGGFLQETHWYANWKHDFDLYAEILAYCRSHHVRLVGLNIPFHIPALVRAGGIDSLLEDDRRYLPDRIDLGVEAHRAMLKSVFERHERFLRGSPSFDHFYQAQCVWEETMAESIAGKLGDGPMVVLIGNGHIVHKFGVPDRAFARIRKEFRTVYLAGMGQEVERSFGDFIWVAP